MKTSGGDQIFPVALSLGSNLGDRKNYIRRMEKRISEILEPPFRLSSLMETEPVDVKDIQPPYLNRIFCGGFSGKPEQLLELCIQIECESGRTGKGTRQPRTADIDIILFGDLIQHGEKLTIPHPQLFSRRFCIEGLKEIVPEWRVPGTGFTIMELYDTIWSEIKNQNVELITA